MTPLARSVILGLRFMMRRGNLDDLEEIRGHMDIKMTQRYAHLSPSHLRSSIAALDGVFVPAPASVSLAVVEPVAR